MANEDDNRKEQPSEEHLLHLKDDKLVLRVDAIMGTVADVVCAHCGKTGIVRLHWEEVDWDESAGETARVPSSD